MMMVKQLSVFLENRNGRLDDVLKALAKNQINIVALSLADTSDFGVLRMMVSDPEKGRDILKAAGFTAMLTDLSGVDSVMIVIPGLPYGMVFQQT